MTTVESIHQFVNEFAPKQLAEDWDNTGLLVGDRQAPVQRVMTCLTVTPESAAEAVARQADVIVSHHPLPFRSMKKITTDQVASRLLLQLIRAGISIISPHTAFDSAEQGINYQLATRLGLTNCNPLVPSETMGDSLGAARVGQPPAGASLSDLIEQARSSFDLSYVRFVGDLQQAVTSVAVCCGSGGSFLDKAIHAGCDAMVTGEATFHTCLEARANRVGLVLLGHHHSERFAVEMLADRIGQAFSDLSVWASEQESDPIQMA